MSAVIYFVLFVLAFSSFLAGAWRLAVRRQSDGAWLMIPSFGLMILCILATSFGAILLGIE